MKKLANIFVALILCVLFSGCTGIFHSHNYQYENTVEPTCTEIGYDLYSCTECGGTVKRNRVQATGHAPTVTRTGYEATCLQEGMSDEITCVKCQVVLESQQKKDALRHSIEVSKQGYAATCLKDGCTNEEYCVVCKSIIQEQESIFALGHIDSNVNSLCDRCGIPYGENIQPISSIEDFKNIASNLDGVYRLTQDICFEGINWIALGNAGRHLQGI